MDGIRILRDDVFYREDPNSWYSVTGAIGKRLNQSRNTPRRFW